MKVAIYARVSTDEQNVKQQVDYLKTWCVSSGNEVIKAVTDEESGRLPLIERKKFKALLAEASHQPAFEAILVLNIDRLTRNWDDVTYLERFFRENWTTCKLVSVSDSIDLSNASGRLMFRIKMATNCYMPEDMREKQVIGIERAKKEGKFTGRKHINFKKK
jgi:DNA invertase Pin-like site-specific DNA recombinase